MTDTIFACRCGYKCVETQLAKTDGFCPRCNEGRPDMMARHDKTKFVKRGA